MQAAMKKYEAQASGSTGQFAVVAAEQFSTLAGQISAWRAQRNRMQLIEQAETLARADVAALTDDHVRLGAEAQAAEAKAAAAKAAGESSEVRVKELQSMAEQRKILGILDDRLAAQQQLVTLYGRWGTQVEIQHKIVVHLMLRSLSWIAAIVLLTILAGWALHVALERISHDLRQRQMLRMVLNLGTQLIGLLLVLLVIFGTPKATAHDPGAGHGGIDGSVPGLHSGVLRLVCADEAEGYPGGRLGRDRWGWRRGGGGWAVADLALGNGKLDGEWPSDGAAGFVFEWVRDSREVFQLLDGRTVDVGRDQGEHSAGRAGLCVDR